MGIDPSRLWQRIEKLSTYTDAGRPWTRRSFSKPFVEARSWLADTFAEAGLKAAVDAGGNLVGRREGRRRDRPPIVTGSHSDTVAGGGRFDGILGVVAGIEVAHALRDSDVELNRPLDVIDFLAEEPSEYGVSCIGSRALARTLEPTMLEAKAGDGETLAEGLRRVGGRPEMLDTAARRPHGIAAFVELHIEQGPVLESRGVPIGVVTNIVGIRRVRIRVTGRPDHAGTTPMDLRRDALVGAARLIEAANARARAMAAGRHYVVATIGHIRVEPNAANAVPGEADMILEVRSDDEDVLGRFPEDVAGETADALAGLGLSVRMDPISYSPPTDCSPDVQDAVEAASRALGLPSLRLPSGAGHDGVQLARIGPVGMIFIPCLGGRSHCPEEWATPDDVANGARVLYETILELDRRLP